jgi:hypothetical protein
VRQAKLVRSCRWKSGPAPHRSAKMRRHEHHVAGPELREAATRSADSNKSEIAVVCDTEDTWIAKAFSASAVSTGKIKAGVLDTPTIYFLEWIELTNSSTKHQ